MALKTITSEHRDPQQVSIHFPPDFTSIDLEIRFGEAPASAREWWDLDRFLVQLWESRSIRPKITSNSVLLREAQAVRCCVEYLLPEVTKRGVDYYGIQQV